MNRCSLCRRFLLGKHKHSYICDQCEPLYKEGYQSGLVEGRRLAEIEYRQAERTDIVRFLSAKNRPVWGLIRAIEKGEHHIERADHEEK